MLDIFKILPIVKGAINELFRWLEKSVEEFPRIEHDDRWGYARVIAIMLVERNCNCGRANCPREHDLSQWNPHAQSLSSFIYTAVIGPSGFQVNAIVQGMLFPLLHTDHGLLVVKVGFKQCAKNAEHKYEGTICPYCNHVFDPAATPVLAKDWLVIQGVYVPEDLRWWACGKGRKAHYYAQRHCRELLVDNPERYPDPAYHVQHGDNEHDRCSLKGCPRHDQEHGERGTTLWWRAVFAAPTQAPPRSRPLFMQSVVEGTREVVAALQGWKYVWALFLARENPEAPPPGPSWKEIFLGGSQLADSELLTLTQTLFNGREKGALSHSKARRQLSAHANEIAQALYLPQGLRFPQTTREIICFEQKELKPQVQDKVLRALQKNGINEEEIRAWLQEQRDLKAEWMEDNDDDNE